MAKMTGLKFTNEITAPNKVALTNALEELNAKLDAKFPMTISVGKGKEKVSLTISIAE
jgi:hypothetical protein